MGKGDAGLNRRGDALELSLESDGHAAAAKAVHCAAEEPCPRRRLLPVGLEGGRPAHAIGHGKDGGGGGSPKFWLRRGRGGGTGVGEGEGEGELENADGRGRSESAARRLRRGRGRRLGLLLRPQVPSSCGGRQCIVSSSESDPGFVIVSGLANKDLQLRARSQVPS